MKLFFLTVVVAGLTACGAGSGEGLNEQGLPNTSSSGSSSSAADDGVTLAQLQQDIFGAICTNCHTGANAPRGLRLDSEENSYAFLVNRSADEIPSLMRVNPGKPDESYLIKKLEGANDIVGARMPLGGPFLSQAQIDLVRSWIANGAPRTGTGAATTKVARTSIQKSAGQVSVELMFSRAVQFETINPEAIDVYYKASGQWYSLANYSLLLNQQTLSIGLNNLPAQATELGVVIHDHELQQLLDQNYQAVDGDGDEIQGGGYSYVYSL